jgi:CubicO group peptidase (beta-lactamase class C family)
MRRFWLSLAGGLAAVAAAGWLALGQTAAGPLDDAAVRELMKQFNVPGVSVAVIKDFTIDSAKGFGVADAETGAPVTVETMFQAASISKTVAAMASLKAVQEGRFKLDQDVNTILKSWRLPGGEFTKERPVTPRALMSHTSGTGDGFGFPGYAPNVPLPTIVQILDGVPPSNRQKVRLERPPLSDAVGKPFPHIAEEWVLRPLGMSNSTYENPLPASREKQAARAHSQTGARMGDRWHVYGPKDGG